MVNPMRFYLPDIPAIDPTLPPQKQARLELHFIDLLNEMTRLYQTLE
jgi:hypothetical protein